MCQCMHVQIDAYTKKIKGTYVYDICQLLNPAVLEIVR